MNKQALLSTGNPALRCGLLLGILLIANAPSTTLGQQVRVGDMIGVRASPSTGTGRGWTEGSVVRLTPDSLWYRSSSSGGSSRMSMDNTNFQRPTHRDHRWVGLAIGGVTVGALGAWLYHAGYEPSPFNSRAEVTAVGALRGVFIGGGLGYFLGKALGRWETVAFDQVTVGDGNLAVSMRVRR